MEKNVLMDRIYKIVVPFIAVLAIIGTGYFYNQVRLLKQTPQAVAQKEAIDLTAQVGKLMVLPKDETPTIATVSDPSALKDQPFFASAVKGDKVLIYAQAKKAILYSVSLNKILDVAPLNIGNGTQKAAETTTAPAATTPAPATTPKKQ